MGISFSKMSYAIFFPWSPVGNTGIIFKMKIVKFYVM